jgi:hypothetical protein
MDGTEVYCSRWLLLPVRCRRVGGVGWREIDLWWRSVHGVQCACEGAALTCSGWRRQAASGGLS